MDVTKTLPIRKYSFKEYLELEEKAEFKSEFWNGDMVERSSITPTRSKIANSIGTALDNQFDTNKPDCAVYDSGSKVFSPKFNHVACPDCMVVCGEEEFHEDSKVVLSNPSLIIEVLSESTKSYDLSAKFEGYRSIPAFREYVLVWQTIPKVQTWYKEAEDLWRISSAFGLDKSIQLYSIDCEIALADIYKRVKSLGEVDNPKAY